MLLVRWLADSAKLLLYIYPGPAIRMRAHSGEGVAGADEPKKGVYCRLGYTSKLKILQIIMWNIGMA